MTESQLRQTVWITLISFSLVGFIMLAVGIRICILADKSHSWPQVTGRIVNIQEVSSSNIRSGSSRRIAVLYDYAVGGQSYQGTRASFGLRGQSVVQQLRKLHNGDSVSVYVDPGDASNSVLFPGIRTATCIPLFIGVGLLGFAALFGFLAFRDPPWQID